MHSRENGPSSLLNRHVAPALWGVRYVLCGAVLIALLSGLRQGLEPDARASFIEQVLIGAVAGSLLGALIWGVKSLQEPGHRWLGLVLVPTIGGSLLLFLVANVAISAEVIMSAIVQSWWLNPFLPQGLLIFMVAIYVAPLLIGVLFLIQRRINRDR